MPDELRPYPRRARLRVLHLPHDRTHAQRHPHSDLTGQSSWCQRPRERTSTRELTYGAETDKGGPSQSNVAARVRARAEVRMGAYVVMVIYGACGIQDHILPYAGCGVDDHSSTNHCPFPERNVRGQNSGRVNGAYEMFIPGSH